MILVSLDNGFGSFCFAELLNDVSRVVAKLNVQGADVLERFIYKFPPERTCFVIKRTDGVRFVKSGKCGVWCAGFVGTVP